MAIFILFVGFQGWTDSSCAVCVCGSSASHGWAENCRREELMWHEPTLDTTFLHLEANKTFHGIISWSILCLHTENWGGTKKFKCACTPTWCYRRLHSHLHTYLMLRYRGPHFYLHTCLMLRYGRTADYSSHVFISWMLCNAYAPDIERVRLATAKHIWKSQKHTFVKRNTCVALRWKRNFLKRYWNCNGSEHKNHQKEAWCVSFRFHENIMSFQNVMKRTAENRSLPKFMIQESHVFLFPPFRVFAFGESPLIESYCLNILWFVCRFYS